ncbi:MAG: rRNA maturation RNase YbeY [Parachlamydiales bacterium]|jgi:probable rRNA maturation factor
MDINSVTIDVVDEQNDFVIQPEQVKAIVKEVVLFEGQRFNEVAVFFITNEKMCEMHAEFFDDPSPTDCISLPMDEEEGDGYRHLGEIFVCPFTAKEFVSLHGGSCEEEVTLYIVHGLLHLMGYDDIDETDEAAMRTAEARHLMHLKERGLCLSSL